MNNGLTHIYCGDGKGKTTAAVGLCTRAAGAGFKIMFAQFIKGTKTCETDSLEKLGVNVLKSYENTKFIIYMTDEEKGQYILDQNALIDEISSKIKDYDLVVLDEILGAIEMDIIKQEVVISIIKKKPSHTEIVLTGRIASKELSELADYISEIKKISHPYEKGINARRGIEL